MASATQIALLLVLMGVGAYAVDGSTGRKTTAGWNGNMINKEENSNSPRVAIPSILMDHASPLDAGAASSYAAKIEAGSINQDSKIFCSDAKLLCDANVEILDPSLDISLDRLMDGNNLLEKTKDMLDATQAMYFGEKELAVGKDITMPATLRDAYPTTSFLPQSIAKVLPFSSARMPELLQKLNIPQNSNLAVMMGRTLAQCEARTRAAPAEESPSQCVTSLEDMTSFVADRFPHAAHISALDRTITTVTDAPQNGQAGEANDTFKVLDVKEYGRSVVCHKSMFPYAVYECRDTDAGDNMKTYAVAMESRNDGRRVNQVALCRADGVGSESPKRKPTPGPLGDEAAACHWVSDAFVWAPATTL